MLHSCNPFASFVPEAVTSLRSDDFAKWEDLRRGISQAKLPSPAIPSRVAGTADEQASEAA